MAEWLIGSKISSNNWRFAWDRKDPNDLSTGVVSVSKNTNNTGTDWPNKLVSISDDATVGYYNLAFLLEDDLDYNKHTNNTNTTIRSISQSVSGDYDLKLFALDSYYPRDVSWGTGSVKFSDDPNNLKLPKGKYSLYYKSKDSGNTYFRLYDVNSKFKNLYIAWESNGQPLTTAPPGSYLEMGGIIINEPINDVFIDVSSLNDGVYVANLYDANGQLTYSASGFKVAGGKAYNNLTPQGTNIIGPVSGNQDVVMVSNRYPLTEGDYGIKFSFSGNWASDSVGQYKDFEVTKIYEFEWDGKLSDRFNTWPAIQDIFITGNTTGGVINFYPGENNPLIVSTGNLSLKRWSCSRDGPFNDSGDLLEERNITSVDFTDYFPLNFWFMRIEGYIFIPEGETYTFYISTDDGTKLWIDDQLVLESWTVQPSREYNANFTRGRAGWYKIKIEHYNGAPINERLLLKWQSSSINKSTVPSNYFGVPFTIATDMISITNVKNYSWKWNEVQSQIYTDWIYDRQVSVDGGSAGILVFKSDINAPNQSGTDQVEVSEVFVGVAKFNLNEVDQSGNIISLLGSSQAEDKYTYNYTGENDLNNKIFRVMGLDSNDITISTSPSFTVSTGNFDLPAPVWLEVIKITDTSWKFIWPTIAGYAISDVLYDFRKIDLSNNSTVILETVSTPVYILETDPSGYGFDVIAKHLDGSVSNPGPLLVVPKINIPTKMFCEI